MKKILSIVLVCILAVGLISCGGKEENNEPTSSVAPTEVVVNPNDTNSTTPEVTATPEAEKPTAVPTEAPSDEPVEFIPFSVGSAIRGKYENFQEICSVSVPYLALADEYKEKYSKLSSIFDSFNTSYANGIGNILDSLNSYSMEKYNSMEDKSEYVASLNDNNVAVVRSDSAVFSFVVFDRFYENGGEPSINIGTYNINTKTGGFLQLSDVFVDGGALRKAVSAKVKEEYQGIKFFMLDDMISASIADTSLKFTVGQEGVNIYFAAGEIAAYDEGIIVVSLDYKDYPDLIKNVLFNTDDEYSLILQTDTEYCLDLDNDGKTEKFKLFAKSEDSPSGDINKLYFYVNGENVLAFDIFDCYSVVPIFVKTKSGKCFIYTQTTYMSEDNCVYGFAFEGNKVVALGDVCERFVSGYDEINEVYFSIVHANKASTIKTLSRTDLVSTCFVERTHEVADDGTLNPIEDFYRFNSYIPEITAMEDIEVVTIDEAGNENGTATLKAGETIKANRLVDFETCDFTKEDGSWIRIYFDNDIFGQINGVPVYDLFENVRFAD